MARDYYETLGINRNASDDEIKKAFRTQAKKYHPDANPDNPQAEERFKEINEAYEVLRDPEKRQTYDQFGNNWEAYQRGGFGGQGYGSTQVNFDNLEEVLGSMFGGGFGNFSTDTGTGSTGGRRRRRSRAKGRDIEQPVSITLQEAYQGTQRVFTKEGEPLTVNIPAGAKNGTKVRVKGEGMPGAFGGPHGDLMLVVSIDESNSPFTRDGDHLHTDVTVDLFTAILGGEVEIPTMARPVKLTVPAGTQSGRKFRLKGKGMPLLRKSDEFGDLYARMMISIPKNLNDAQRELVEKLRDSLQS